MSKLLENLGCQCEIANHGEEAQQLLNSNEYSVILMDFQMPVMNGFACTSLIRKREDSNKRIPIIAITADIMDANEKQCLECGLDDFIEKPIMLAKLKKCLDRFISNHID